MRLKQLWIAALAIKAIVAADANLKVTEAEAKRAAIEKPAPEYPLVARQLKVVGKVNLEVSVGENGAVSEVKIVSGNAILTKPAVEAVKKWRFRPFQSEGKPVPAVASLSFEFDTH